MREINELLRSMYSIAGRSGVQTNWLALIKHIEEALEQTHNLPTVVCLCGSTRFKDAFDEVNYQETMKGNIVLSVGFFMHATGNRHGGNVGATPEQKIALDVLHKRKIDLADEVLILNVGGYVGESTRSEIEYAKSKGKPIRWLEPPCQTDLDAPSTEFTRKLMD